jgi:hypothetical protein
MRTLVMLLLLTTLVVGCAEKSVMTIVDEAGNVIGTITDAAVQRDLIYNKTLQNRDNKYAAAYKSSGMSIEYSMVDVNGVQAWLPKETTIRGEPQFTQHLESRPPDHRGWSTADKALNVVTLGLSAYFLNDFAKHSVSNSGSKQVIGGDFQSHNPVSTAEPFFAPAQ